VGDPGRGVADEDQCLFSLDFFSSLFASWQKKTKPMPAKAKMFKKLAYQ